MAISKQQPLRPYVQALGDAFDNSEIEIGEIAQDVLTLQRSMYEIPSEYVRTFDTVAEMQADDNLRSGMTCHTNGFHSAGDGGAAYYTIGASGVADKVDVIACGDLFANRASYADKMDYLHNTPAFMSSLYTVSNSYETNLDSFAYGSTYTALDNVTQQVDGKWHMDCSAFTWLIVQGVSFNNSKYNGLAANVYDESFYQISDVSEYRTANRMAMYASAMGYGFVPKPDLSDLEPGDVLFYSYPWIDTDFHNNAYKKIDHCNIFAGFKNEHVVQVINWGEDVSTVFTEMADSSVNFSCVVYAARFPFSYEAVCGQNIIENATQQVDVSASARLATLTLHEPLKAGSLYTLCLDFKLNVSGMYLTVYPSTQTLLIRDDGFGNDTTRHKHMMRFVCPDASDGQTIIRIVMSSETVSDADKDGTLYGASLFEGYLPEFYIPQNLDYSRTVSSSQIVTRVDSGTVSGTALVTDHALLLNVEFGSQSIATTPTKIASIASGYRPKGNVNFNCYAGASSAIGRACRGYVTSGGDIYLCSDSAVETTVRATIPIIK